DRRSGNGRRGSPSRRVYGVGCAIGQRQHELRAAVTALLVVERAAVLDRDVAAEGQAEPDSRRLVRQYLAALYELLEDPLPAPRVGHAGTAVGHPQAEHPVILFEQHLDRTVVGIELRRVLEQLVERLLEVGTIALVAPLGTLEPER